MIVAPQRWSSQRQNRHCSRFPSAHAGDTRSALARAPGCPIRCGVLRALRRCGLSAAESPAAIGTSTASWRGTLNAPGIRICDGCELAAIVGGAPLTPSVLSAAGARRPGCGQPPLQHRSAWQRRDQPDRQKLRVGPSRCRGARPDQARRAASATASRDRRQRTLVRRPDPLRGWVQALR
jgi:hypothetical protein